MVKTPGMPCSYACSMEMLDGRTKDSLFMLAVKRVPLGPWHRLVLLRCFEHWLSPRPIVKKRFSSITVGTSTFLGLLKLLLKAVTVAVSLKAGRVALTGLLDAQFLAAQGADLYSRMAVVVVLSNGTLGALA